MSKIKENSFISGDFVVYPSHGVGKIIGTETREIEQIKLELLVIRFEQDRMTLRVPLDKAKNFFSPDRFNGVPVLPRERKLHVLKFLFRFCS